MSNKECVITYCDNEDNKNEKLIRICSNDHYMHINCLKQFLKKDNTPKCPICRDDYIDIFKKLILDNPAEESENEEMDEFPREFIFLPYISLFDRGNSGNPILRQFPHFDNISPFKPKCHRSRCAQ